MFQENFRPFAPRDLDRFLQELRDPNSTFDVNSSCRDLRPSPGGYAEINQMYHRAIFDRRGTAVRLTFNPQDPVHRDTLWQVKTAFCQELQTLAQRYEIPKHGFAISIQDCSVVTGKKALEYYLRVEVLDGNLRPTIITDGCVQSFQKAPVAFMVSWDSRVREAFARPILTATAFNDLMRNLRDTPLDRLAKIPTPNYAFLLICNAMQKYIDDSNRKTDLGFSFDDREFTGQYLSSPREYEGIARDIEHLEVTGGYYSPRVAVTCAVDGEPTRFEIEVKRHFNFGWVAAQVTKVTPVLK